MIANNLNAGLRLLKSRPIATAFTCLMLAFGIGANLAIFSLVRVAFLKSLPFPDPGSLVTISEHPLASSGFPFRSIRLPFENFAEVRDQQRVFSAVALYLPPGRGAALEMLVRGAPKPVRGAIVSAQFFAVLGIPPKLGRSFAQRDEGERVAILGHELADRLFGAAPLGPESHVAVNNRVYQVIGVMPPGFDFPDGTELWLPGAAPGDIDAIANLPARPTELLPLNVARLVPGLKLDQAEALLRTPLSRLSEGHLPGRPLVEIKLTPLKTALFGAEELPLAELLTGSLLTLIAAWTVVWILAWLGAAKRLDVIAIRLALGASRWQAVSDLVWASLVLALASTAGAGLAEVWVRRIGHTLLPALAGQLEQNPAPAWRLVVWACSCAFCAILPSVAAALRASRAAVRRERCSQLQLRALAVALAAVACLTIPLASGALDSLSRFTLASKEPIGWNPSKLWVYSLRAYNSRNAMTNAESRQLADRYRSLETALLQMPGVLAVGLSDVRPFSSVPQSTISVQLATGAQQATDSIAASPGLLAAMQIHLLAGRNFSPAEYDRGSQVAIVDQTFARQQWGRSNPLGKVFRTTGGLNFRIIGVVAPVRLGAGMFAPPRPTVLLPLDPSDIPAGAWLYVRAVNGASASRQIVHAIELADGQFAAVQGSPALDMVAQDRDAPESRVELLTAFGALACSLVLFGCFAVAEDAARGRRREAAVRIALGATPKRILGMMLGSLGAPLTVGAGCGCFLTVLSSRILESTSPLHAAPGLTLALLVAAGVGATGYGAIILASLKLALTNPTEILLRW